MPNIITLSLKKKEDNSSTIQKIATITDEAASLSRNIIINIAIDDKLLCALEYTHLDFDEELFQEWLQEFFVADAIKEASEQYEVFLHNYQDEQLPFEAPLNTLSYTEVAEHFKNTVSTILEEFMKHPYLSQFDFYPVLAEHFKHTPGYLDALDKQCQWYEEVATDEDIGAEGENLSSFLVYVYGAGSNGWLQETLEEDMSEFYEEGPEDEQVVKLPKALFTL